MKKEVMMTMALKYHIEEIMNKEKRRTYRRDQIEMLVFDLDQVEKLVNE